MKLERELELKAVTIGKPTEVNGTVYLSKYDSNWPKTFATEKNIILSVLKDVEIEHVGSTSVPGLCAKPIIDIILLVNDSANEASYVPQLEKLGYYLKIREPDWFEHRLLNKRNAQINLHVFSKNCAEAQRMIAFRDILRHNPDALKKYAQKKQDLAKKTWKYIQEYADAKSEVVKEILSQTTINDKIKKQKQK